MNNLYYAIKTFINGGKKYDNLNYMKYEHNELGHLLFKLYLKYI